MSNDDFNTDKCGEIAVAPPLLSCAKYKNDVTPDNQPEIIQQLTEQVQLLENAIVRL